MANYKKTIRFNTRGTKQLRFLRRWYCYGSLNDVVEDVITTGLQELMSQAAYKILEQNYDEVEAFMKSIDWSERNQLRLDGEDIDHDIPF